MPDPRRHGVSGGPVVWVGAAGSGNGFGVLAAARERYGDRVVLVSADTNPAHLCAGAAIADEHVQAPAATEPDFGPWLAGELERVGATVYVPIVDPEIRVAADLAERGGLPAGVQTLAPTRAAAARCFDKLALARWLESEGLPAPLTVPAAEARWRDGGLVAKPRAGWGSTGVRVLERPDQLAGLARDDVVQERCERPEVTIDAYRLDDGTVPALCRERIEVKAGVCVKARVFADAELSALAGAIGERLPLRGAFCFQVMRRGGGWAVTDVNPRVGSGSRMSSAVGFDLPGAVVCGALGDDPRPLLRPPAGERWVVRQWREIVLST
jgi:carbamoylphosphate synthase large subunit